MPYSDLPPGAVVMHDPGGQQYSDLPPGATVIHTPEQGFWQGLQNYVEHPEQRGAGQPNALNRFGGAMVQTVGNAVQHPLDTIGSAVKSTVLATTPLVGMVSPQTAANNNPVVQTVRDAKQNGMAVAAGHLVGGMAVGTALGEGLGAVAEAAPKVIPAVGKAATVVGDTAQDAGTGLMNKTVGTLKSDFKRGANPARGYLETGNGPSMSMHSIADKSATALEETGSKLGDIYQKVDATGLKIPVDTVAQEMAKPLQKAIDLETGPGGTGNLSTIQSYIQQFEPAFAKAAQNGGFTPSELFKMKRSIAENTNWSDPAQFNLKAVRQQQTGAISGILSDAVPETKALNQTYQDLIKMTDRAQERANTGSRPLTAHIYKAGMTAVGALAGGMEGNALAGAAAGAILDSVPAKTTIATGLFRGGKALSALGERLAPVDSATVEGVAPNDLGGNGANNKPGNPQGTPPESSNPTTATQKWAALGTEKVLAHLSNDASSGLTPEDIAEAAKSPQGKQLLLQASSLQPGTPMMEKIVNKIPRPTTDLLPGDIGRVPIGSLNLDPKRFQYKLNTDASGSTNKLKDVPWNDSLSGVVTAWRDPTTGTDYVINGHHRYDLAKRNGAPDIAVRMLPDDVKTPAEARIVGALQNIAEGNGTATDAAKFLRDTTYTPEDLARHGVSLSGPVAEGGASLARLTPKLFDDVVAGRLQERRGIAIGNAAETPEQQETLLKMIARAETRGRTVTNATIEELGRMVKSSGDVTTSQDSLFGTETRTQNLALEKADVSAYLRSQIASEKKLFAGLTSTSKADRLGVVGNKIETKENAAVATAAGQAQEIYDRLSTRTGPVDDILNASAQRIARGENANTVKAEAYRSIRAALSESLRGGQEATGGSPQIDSAGPENLQINR